MGGKKKKNKSKNNNQGKDEQATYDKDVNIENEVQMCDIEDNIEKNERTEKNSQKRKHVSNDSDEGTLDTDPKPKKSKKKKISEQSESSDKKNKSIRQMKKEKHVERQAAAESQAKDHLKSQCLNYLSQWKHDKSNWRFMKTKQVWLFKNKFAQNLVPDASWPILLEYFESAQGNIRNMLLTDANKIIKQMDDWTESQNNEENTENEDSENASLTKPDDIVYKRARSLIQCLEE